MAIFWSGTGTQGSGRQDAPLSKGNAEVYCVAEWHFSLFIKAKGKKSILPNLRKQKTHLSYTEISGVSLACSKHASCTKRYSPVRNIVFNTDLDFVVWWYMLRKYQDQERWLVRVCSNPDLFQLHLREDNRQVSWCPFADLPRAVCMSWVSS